MKVLVISNEEHVRNGMVSALKIKMKGDAEFFRTDHDEALNVFPMEDWKAVIVFNYNEEGIENRNWNRGRDTFKKINDSTNGTANLIRIGFSGYPYDDYLQVPFTLAELISKIKHE